ncbi:hypothetical protein GCM10027054_24770 [Isoptericola nanjingensis]
MTTFELVPDDEREDAPDGAPDDRPEEGRRHLADLRDRALARWRGLSRRGRAAVAAGTAVVVVAVAGAAVAPGLLDARAERLRAEAVQGLPGVVDDLSAPLDVVWSLSEGSSVAAVFSGGVLAVTDSAGVRAIDAASGHVVWEHPLDDGAMCGPTPWTPVDWRTPVRTVVCVEDLDTVTVLDDAGTVLGERELDLSSASDDSGNAPVWPQVLPAADGSVAVLDDLASTTEFPWHEGDDDADVLRTLRDAGRADPTMRVLDAATGEERTEVSLHLSADDIGSCGFSEGGPGGTALAPQPWIDATPTSTVLSLCGLERAVTPMGDVVDLGDGASMLAPLPGGGYLAQGDVSEVLDAHGERLTAVRGLAQVPLVDADPTGPVLAVRGGDGDAPALAAVGADGRTDWSSSIDEYASPVARVGDTVVVAGETAVAALDARTGEERWRRTDVIGDRDASGSAYVSGAVTDGTRLLLATTGATVDADTGEFVSGSRLLALDLRDGTTVWEQPHESDLWGLFSAGGHLVSAGSVMSGLGRP